MKDKYMDYLNDINDVLKVPFNVLVTGYTWIKFGFMLQLKDWTSSCSGFTSNTILGERVFIQTEDLPVEFLMLLKDPKEGLKTKP